MMKRSEQERFWSKVKVLGPDECWEWMTNTNRKRYPTFWSSSLHRHLGAHQFSYILSNGPIPKGELIRHSCHNKWCVNPNHLSSGTHQDNANDMVAAGRSRVGERHHNFGKFGEDNPNFGKRWTEEMCQKQSQILTGRTVPEETKARIANSMMGEKNHFYGKKHSLETKAKISAVDRSGEHNSRSIVTATQVLEIRKEYATGDITIKKLATKYGLTEPGMYSIISRRTWKHI